MEKGTQMVAVGVIGVGSFGEKRAAAAAKARNGKLVAIADLTTERANTVADKLGAKAQQIDDLLGNPEIDVGSPGTELEFAL